MRSLRPGSHGSPGLVRNGPGIGALGHGGGPADARCHLRVAGARRS